MKRARILQTVVACFTACAALAQQGTVPAAPVSPPDEEDVPAEEEPWDFLIGRKPDPEFTALLDRMLPMGGKPHEGLRYPIYGQRPEKGAPPRKALFESKKVTRMDDTYILFEDVVYRSYGNPKKPDTPRQTIHLKEAIYDLKHNFVFSEVPLTVEDREFSVHCGRVLRDLTTGLTVYSGGVELYDEPEEPHPAAPPESSPAPASPSPAAPEPPKPQNSP